LRELGNINVENILYEFHFYEPFLFTHQGADWTDGKTNITNLPYPYKRKEMPQVSNEAKKPSADDYERYPDEANRQFCKGAFKGYCKSIVRSTGCLLSAPRPA